MKISMKFQVLVKKKFNMIFVLTQAFILINFYTYYNNGRFKRVLWS
jgi:hypothetical protein